ncbi:cytoplasmic dynein 2 intermediate chain 1-like [Styela clava]
MSERRKKDRYNETWTKEELTSSLRKSEKSSHKSSRHKDEDDGEDYYIKKERKRRDERDESHKKSRSDRPRESSGRVKDSDDRKREHRSKRDDDREHREDRHRTENDKEKYYKTNGDESRRVSERSHRSEKSSRDDRERSHRSEKPSRDERERSHRSEKTSRDDRERKHRNRDEEYYKEKRERRREDDDKRRKKHESDNYDRDEDYDKKQNRDEKSHRRQEKDRRTHDEDVENLRKEKRGQRRRENDEDEDRRLRKEKSRREKESEYDIHKSRDRDKERESRNDKHSKPEKHSRKNRDDDDSGSYRQSRHHRSDNDRHHKDGKSNKGSKNDEQKSMNSTYVIDDEKDRLKNDNNNEYNYEDEEFEDYDDDFEDDDDNNEDTRPISHKQPDKMDELMRAIAAENERANSAQSSGQFRSTANSDRNDSPFSSSNDAGSHREGSASSGIRNTSSTMINFSAAKKSSASSKTKRRVIKRSKDLMSLIQLDSVSFDILDMPPVTEYNLYIKNYGNSNTVQASVQCNDDNLEQEIQTESPDMDEKWSQHPPHEIKCSGGIMSKFSETQSENEDRARMLSTMRGNSKRLIKFMSRSCKLIKSILIEDETWENTGARKNQSSALSFCESCVPLQTNLAYLQGRKVVHIASSSGSSDNFVAVAFEPASTSFSTRIDRKGLVSVWDTRKPGIPEKILVCDACPTYCSFGSTKSYILFVGTDDGCVLAYDLREPGIHHQVVSLEKTRETVLRSATYTTGYLNDGHSSPIVSIMSVGAESKFSEENQFDSKEGKSRNSHSGLAFQLASLEEAGNLCIWIVVELLPDGEAGDDLGLAPQGKIKLIRSLNVKIHPPVKSLIPDLPFRTTCVQFSVLDPNNFYVGTDTGHIVHCTQYEANSESSMANKNKVTFFNEIDTISSVTSIDLNPFQLFGASMILAGYDDGSIRLYLSDRGLPVVSWPFSTDSAGIVKVQWSTSRPSVFFVLDSSNRLHIWDLAIMHAGPIKTEQFENKPICHFALSNTPENSTTRTPEIAIAYRFEESSNKDVSLVEVHKLAPHFSQVTDNNELDQLTFLLQSLL